MKKCSIIIYSLLSFIILFPVTPVHSADIQRLGIVPFYAPEKIWNLYAPFTEYLSQNTGYRWELKLYNTHEAIIEGVCAGEVSVAFLGPVPFGRALERCNTRPLLVALSSDGKPEYSAIIATADPGVRTLADIRGKRFGFFEGSTAAYVLPRKMLEDEGIAASSIEPVFLKGQDRIMDALLKREVAAAGMKEALYEKFRTANIRVLKISLPVPNFAFCASPAIGRAAEKKFVEALIRLRPRTDPEDHRKVQEWDDEIRHGFIPPPKNYVAGARGLADLFHRYRR